MLQSIRDKATGWLAYVIIGLIAIPFALWGLGEYFGGAGPLVAAEVNGEEIPVRLVQQEVRVQRDEIARMFGGTIPPNLFDERELREAALESLIQRALLRQAADRNGFRASPEGVVTEIQALPVFQENGRFSPERYYAVLQAQRLVPGDFERDVGQSIVLSQARQAIAASGELPQPDVETFARLRNQVRVASWLTFDPANYARPDVVEAAAIEAFYLRHADRFSTPERLRVNYLQLDPNLLEARIDVTEDEIREHYEINAARYAEPELRRVRQVFIGLGSADAEARIRALRNRMEAGEDFSDLAREYSEDSLSADRGGAMGLVERGDLDSTLETVIFSLPVGLTSQPVRTRLGWHIVEVTAIQAARRTPFDEVRMDVERDLRDRRAEQRQIQVLDALLSQAFEHPDSLEPAAAASGLRIETSAPFSRMSGTGLAQYRAVREAAFSPAVFEDGRNSEAIDLPDGSTVVLRVQERQPAQLRPLAEVEDEIRVALQADAAANAARADGERLLAELESTDVRAWLEAEDRSDLVRAVTIHRSTGPLDDILAPRELVEALFRLSPPADGDIRVTNVALPDGTFIVLFLEAVRILESDGIERDRSAIADDLQMAYAEAEFAAYLAWLESQAKIRRYPQNLE
jgi:peptidyl-prolyl cis-trans isomerase D